MADPTKPVHGRGETATMNVLAYDTIVWIINIVLDLFFREVQPRSSWRIPREGPILFVCAPHANQFVDPLLLMRIIRAEARRRVAWLIAAKSMKRGFIGRMAGMVGAVPVGRALDATKTMPGAIYLPSPEDDPTLVRGYGTNFEDTFYQVGGLLVLPSVNNVSANAEIAEIVGPEEIRVKKGFKGDIAINQLTGRETVVPDGKTEEDMPKEYKGTPFKVAPKFDQSGVYNFVSERLGSNGCVGIFPEGGSHDRTELLPLKAGVAIMALETLKDYPTCGLKVVPCGMNYFAAHKFRSRCVVEFGPSIEIKQEWVELYKNGERREAIGKTLDTIHQALRSVTINTPDYETLMLIQAVRRLYKPKHKKMPLTLVVELNRRLMLGYNKYKDDPRIINLKKAVLQYNNKLKQLQIRDHQVEYAKFPFFKALWLLLTRLATLVIYVVFALPGFGLFAPIFAAGKLMSIKKSKEALAASTVKIEARDVVATWKLLVSMAAAPALYIWYTIILTVMYSKNGVWGLVDKKYPTWLFGTVAFFTVAGMSYASLRLGETAMDIIKSLRPLLVGLSPWHNRMLVNLRETRIQLTAQVAELINELGPDMFPDFESKRIIPPSELDSSVQINIGGPSEPTTPTTPTAYSYNQYSHNDSHLLPRNESLHDLSNIGLFASHPASRSQTPRLPRSRSRTGSFGDSLGMTPLTRSDFDEVHRKIQSSMRERGARRRSEGEAAWESGQSTPGSEFDSLMMTKKTK